ncbi:hypothetical protein KI387_044370, partial [Taxus chinensis]
VTRLTVTPKALTDGEEGSHRVNQLLRQYPPTRWSRVYTQSVLTTLRCSNTENFLGGHPSQNYSGAGVLNCM